MAMKGTFFAAATLDMAMDTPVFEPPRTMVRPFWSAHSRNFEAPMSGLFWWSVVSSTIFLPSTLPPKSAIAILAASMPPWPITSAYRLERSSMSPITTSLPAACAAPAVRVAPRAVEIAMARVLSFIGNSMVEKGSSHTKKIMQHGHVGSQLGASKPLDDTAMFHHEEAIRQRCGKAEVLFDHHDRVAACAQRADHGRQGLHDHRRETFGDLVEQQKFRAGAQDARHGKHLLLAARQPRTLAGGALAQVRKHRIDLLDAHAAGGQRRRQDQVLLGRQAGEDAALLRAIAQTEARDPMRGHPDRLDAAHLDRALARADQTNDRAHRAGAPGAIAAEQGDDLAFVDDEIHPVQHMRLAVPAVQVAHLEKGGGAHPCAPSSSTSALPM